MAVNRAIIGTLAHARACAVATAAALLLCCPKALAQNRVPQDGEKLFQLYNSTATPRGFRRHLDRVFDKSPGRISWSTPAKAGARIPAKTGGTVRRLDGAAVVVSSGTLPRDLVVSVAVPTARLPAEETARSTKIAAAGLKSASDPVQFGPEGVSLSSGVTVVLPYNLMSVWTGGLDEKHLGIYAWNRATSNWDALKSTVDPMNRLVSATVSSFTLCEVLGAGRPSTSTVSGLITKALGGSLTRADKAAIIVPPGVLPVDLMVTLSTPTIRVVFEQSLRDRKLDAANLVAVSTAVVYGPESVPLASPVTVVLPYDPKSAQADGLHETDLQVYWWNRDKQVWQWLPSTVDLAAHTVSARTLHLSYHQVLGRRPKVSVPH